MSWAEIKKAINSDLSKPLNVKIDELAEPGMFGMDIISGLRFLRGVYPYHNGASDITINEDATWDDLWGFKRVGKLTIAAGVKLTIARFPFFILADEIEFGDKNSWICADGLSGAASGNFPEGYAAGGTAVAGSARGQGGCGGGLLIILCNALSGANGKITADGGNGYNNGELNGTNAGRGGQGALSANKDNADAAELWGNSFSILAAALGDGGRYQGNPTIHGGTGGGSGAGGSLGASGGSGIGGGGSYEYYSSPRFTSGSPSKLASISPSAFLFLAMLGCKGGGGGGAKVDAASGRWLGGGGGGGAVVVLYRSKTNTPVLQANGGIGVSAAGTANGAAGKTLLLEV